MSKSSSGGGGSDKVTGGLFLLLAVGVWWQTLGLPTDSAIFPRAVALLMAGAALRILLRGSSLSPSAPSGPAADIMPDEGTNRAKLTVITLSTLVYAMLVATVGYFTATAAFIPICALLLGYRNVMAIVGATALYLGLAYGVFIELLQRPLPDEPLLRVLLP